MQCLHQTCSVLCLSDHIVPQHADWECGFAEGSMCQAAWATEREGKGGPAAVAVSPSTQEVQEHLWEGSLATARTKQAAALPPLQELLGQS